ncbi:MAG: DUF3102 domain-containing protein [Clostridiales bacterium]|nr:DUF3102 domain-containing protein [Clostridiales bacterium]
MTMLAKTTETRVLALADYEARIHLYKEQIGTGYIGIGRTLNEAKAAQVVPHGQWEDWVTKTTGLTARQAQRCMQAATEIKDGSAMARLEMSKALLLLGSGLDEEAREEIAEKAVEEGATVKDLQEQLRKAKLQIVQETGAAAEIREALKSAEADREQLEDQMRAAEQGYRVRLDQAREDAYRRGEMAGKADAVQAAREEVQALLQEKQDKIEALEERAQRNHQGRMNEIRSHNEQREEWKRNQADLLAAAEEAEKRAADAEAELEALRAGGAGLPDPAWKVLKVAVTRFMTDCEMLPLDPAALIPEKTRIMANIERLEKWTDMMRIAMAGTVPGEGAVE